MVTNNAATTSNGTLSRIALLKQGIRCSMKPIARRLLADGQSLYAIAAHSESSPIILQRPAFHLKK
jgi:hypothetical protein